MALTPDSNTGFEAGMYDSLARTGLVGLAGSNGSVNWTEDTAVPRNGARCIKSPTSSATAFFAYGLNASRASARMAVRFGSFPAANSQVHLFRFLSNAASDDAYFMLNVDGSGVPRFAHFHNWAIGGHQPFGPNPLQTGVWYLLEAVYDVSTSTHIYYARVDEGTEVSNSRFFGTAQQVSQLQVGHSGASQPWPASGIFLDDFIVGNWDGSGDKFWGDGKGILLKPSGRATAGSTVTVVADAAVEFGNEGGVANPDLDDVAALLDEVPMEQTATGASYLTQDTAFTVGNAPNGYLEVPFEDTTETIFNSVRAVAMVGDSSNSGSNTAAIKIQNNGTDEDLGYGDPGSDPDTEHLVLTPPGGSWSQAEVNALAARFGFATDVAPTPRLLGVLLEVDVAIPPPAPPAQTDLVGMVGI